MEYIIYHGYRITKHEIFHDISHHSHHLFYVTSLSIFDIYIKQPYTPYLPRLQLTLPYLHLRYRLYL